MTAANPNPRPLLSASFHNFWDHFRPESSFFLAALSKRFEVKIEHVGRDLQIFSVFGRPRFNTIAGTRPLRVWWTSESDEPRRAIFDLHFGFLPQSLLGERWHRYPLWITCLNFEDPASVRSLLAPRAGTPRQRFCNFIYSNPTSLRTEFFLRLNARRPVDSLGRLLGGPESPVVDKMAALAQFRFTIAFENLLSPGYVTEKLIQPLLAGSIPIYYGADEAKTDFNPKAFIFARDFGDMNAFIEHILKLDASPAAWAEMAAEPIFRDGRIRYEHTHDFFADRIADALSTRLTAPIRELDNQRLINSSATSGTPLGQSRWHKIKLSAGKRLRKILARDPSQQPP